MDESKNIKDWKKNVLEDVEFLSREKFNELSKNFKTKMVGTLDVFF